MREQIIVSFTSWSKRFENIPAVVTSILNQTTKADRIILNLGYQEVTPPHISDFLIKNNVEIFRTEDTKVYKKLMHTLRRFPDACVINIDDDIIFKPNLIENFIKIHNKYPDYPVSGNNIYVHGMKCHCGETSLTKLEYFGNYLQEIDEELICNCPSDDIVFSYFATINGHPYIEMVQDLSNTLNQVFGYSASPIMEDGIERTWQYLQARFGGIDSMLRINYIQDGYLRKICSNAISQYENELTVNAKENVRNSIAYRLGRLLLKPLKIFKHK